jgi:hypothetical protein
LWIELQRLIFDFARKKVPAVAGTFFVLFTGFLRVVLENVRFLCGVFMVRAWWIRGESWSIDDRSVVG